MRRKFFSRVDWKFTGRSIDGREKKCTRQIKRAKTEYIQSELDEASSDPRKMYGVVNKLLGKNVSFPVLQDVDNTSAASILSLAFFFFFLG